MVKILAFDTETTDKSPVGSLSTLNYKERQEIENQLLHNDPSVAIPQWDNWLNAWPHITQLAYILYDTDNPKKSKIYNKYISISSDIEISAESSKITHIYKTDEDAVLKGGSPEMPNTIILSRVEKPKIVPIDIAMKEFMKDFEKSDIVVGHSIDFDKRMILAELMRLKQADQFNKVLENLKFICTMNKTIDICKIEMTSMYGRKYFKFPKLIEAYEKFFGYKPNAEAMHNALVDVVACLRIFCKLGEPVNFDICGTNDAITKIINSISPPELQCPIKKVKKPKRKSPKKKSKRNY
jgi:DNA polymerase III epsilon subunit-like protein